MNQTKPQNPTNKLLPAGYYEMFGLRIQGWDMKEIAQETGYSYDHVRYLFSKNGVLYDFWREWVRDRKAGRVEQAIDMAFEHLPDVMKANIKHAMTGLEGAPMARKMIFDLTLGDLMKRNDSKETDDSHSSIAELIKAATLAKEAITDGSESTNKDRDNGGLAGEPTSISP